VADNPSADKFGPPPENAQREREGGGGVKLSTFPWGALFFIVYMGLKLWSPRSHGWVSGLMIGLLAFATGVGQFILARQRKAQDGEPDPYTPPTNITR